jgi:predicted aspartyl protease
LISHSGRLHKHPAVIDTGFNGHLSLPEKLAHRYGWRWAGYESYEIATGDIVQENVFLGKIQWFGTVQDIYAVASHAQDILIGTRLLEPHQLLIDFHKRIVRVSPVRMRKMRGFLKGIDTHVQRDRDRV